MVRHSLNYVSWKIRKVVAADLKTIYSAATAEEALLRMQEFEGQWGQDYPTIVKSWRSNWDTHEHARPRGPGTSGWSDR